MKVGLFFGSFNPIHFGHVTIAKNALFNHLIDQIWFVVTPQNPFKKKTNLISKEHRIEMVRLALEKYDDLQASDFEFSLPYPQYTANTLKKIKNQYSEHDFVIIMGSDNYNSLCRLEWHKAQYILDNFQLHLYDRKNSDIIDNNDCIKIPGKFLPISSSQIRNHLSVQNRDLSNMHYLKNKLNKKVIRYIDLHKLYTC